MHAQGQRDPCNIRQVMVLYCGAKRMTVVNSSPYRAPGPIAGRNFSSYLVRPILCSPMRRGRDPAGSGTPSQLTLICASPFRTVGAQRRLMAESCSIRSGMSVMAREC